MCAIIVKVLLAVILVVCVCYGVIRLNPANQEIKINCDLNEDLSEGTKIHN